MVKKKDIVEESWKAINNVTKLTKEDYELQLEANQKEEAEIKQFFSDIDRWIRTAQNINDDKNIEFDPNLFMLWRMMKKKGISEMKHESHHIHEKVDNMYDDESFLTDDKTDYSIKEWTNFNYVDYVDNINEFVSKYNFKDLLGTSVADLGKGKLTQLQINKLKGVLITGFKDNLSINDVIITFFSVVPKDSLISLTKVHYG